MARTRFLQELDELRARLLRMGGLAEQAVDRACQAYIERDLTRCRMVLEGDGMGPSGTVVRQRAAWTPQPDGRVRQFWQQSSDGGTTWTVAFDGWYRRKP